MARKPAVWPTNFRPNPGNFGAQFQTLSRALGTGGTPLTGTATTTVYLGIPRMTQVEVVNAAMQGPTAATGSGAVTAQLCKYDATAAARVTLTAATSLTSDVITSATNNNVEWTITAARPNRTVLATNGDTLFWEIAAAGTVTGPQLTAIAEVAVVTP